MARNTSAPALGAALLLASFTANAATVTMVPSTYSPAVGETFTITLQSNVGNTFGARMILSFDASTVAFLGGATPATGPFSAAGGGLFFKNSPASSNPAVFDISSDVAVLDANPPTYDAAVLSFQVLATGAASIWVWDDGGNVAGWIDNLTAEYIPVTYVQAEVGGPSLPRPVYPPAPVIPVPPAALLFASALGILGFGVRRT